MEIIKTGTMPDGVDIQLEDWSKDYPAIFVENSMLLAFPVAIKSTPRQGYDYPRHGKPFRLMIDFKDKDLAEQAFRALENGEAQLVDYQQYFEYPEMAECIPAQGYGGIYQSAYSMKLSVRPYTALKRADVAFIAEILEMGSDKLRHLPGMNERCFNEVIAELSSRCPEEYKAFLKDVRKSEYDER